MQQELDSGVGGSGWGGWIRTNTVCINSAASYQLDHAPIFSLIESFDFIGFASDFAGSKREGVQTHPRRLEGRYRGGSGGSEWGKEAGPALNPLKGFSACLPPTLLCFARETPTPNSCYFSVRVQLRR